MSKLVDKERLAKLAKALDVRAKEAVAAEKSRAEAAEQAIGTKADNNAAAIAKLNGGAEAEGSVAKAVKDAVDVEQKRAVEVENALDGRIDAIDAKLAGAVDNFFEGAAQGTKVAQMVADINTNKAKLADIEEGKTVKAVIDAAVEAEENRAKGVESGFETRIAANEAFVSAQPAKDKAQDDRLDLIEEMMGLGGAEGDKTAIEELQEAIGAVEDKADAAQSDVDAVEQRLDADGGLVDRIEANEADIARLDGAVDVEGSVKKQIKDAIDAVNGAAEELEGRVAANEEFVAGYAAKEAKVREDFAAADAQVLADAKKYADEEITKLVDSAPDAMNTLNELAEAINANKGVYDAYVEQHAQAMAQQKADLQAEIDADVKVVNDALNAEKERVAGVEANFEGRIAANEAFVAAQPAVDAEQDRRLGVLEAAVGEGGATKEAIDAAQEAADAAQEAADNAQAAADAAQADADAIEKRLDDEGGLVDRLEAAEAFVGAQPAIDAEQDRRIKALEDANAEGGAMAEAVQAAQDAADAAQEAADDAQAAAEAAQGEVDAVELRVDALEAKVGHDVDGENPATGLFLEVDEAKAAANNAQKAADDEKDRAEGVEAAIRGEMAAETTRVNNKIAAAVGVYASEGVEASGLRKEIAEKDAAVRADFAQADSDLHDTIKGEMAAVIQSLVAEITEDGMLRIALGGIQGDDVLVIREQEIPFVTDAEIDEIIAGLDAPAGE